MYYESNEMENYWKFRVLKLSYPLHDHSEKEGQSNSNNFVFAPFLSSSKEYSVLNMQTNNNSTKTYKAR